MFALETGVTGILRILEPRVNETRLEPSAWLSMEFAILLIKYYTHEILGFQNIHQLPTVLILVNGPVSISTYEYLFYFTSIVVSVQAINVYLLLTFQTSRQFVLNIQTAKIKQSWLLIKMD